MKIIKTILFVLLGIVVIAMVTALFIEKDYTVEREIAINKPKQEVFNYIKYLKNQDNFSVWAGMDPDMKKEYRGTDATVGFVSAWNSKSDEVGAGEQEIKGISEGKRIDYELRFIKPMEMTDNAYISTDSVTANQTKVKWGFKGRMDYPMNITMLFMDMDQMLGKDFEQGLKNLKGIMEKQ